MLAGPDCCDVDLVRCCILWTWSGP